MAHTYMGTPVPYDWMPVALANGLEDQVVMPAFDRQNLYRWSAPVSRVIYRAGRLLSRVWNPFA